MADLIARLNAHVADWCVIERELGGGGMSDVFVAFDKQLQRRVVFKVLSSTLTATLSVERFRREIMVAAGLQHPHIVPVLTSGEVDGLPYFVMPFIEGESLRTRLVRGPLSVRETIAVCKDVLAALAFAHGRGVVHRDIKPDNVMLTSGAAVVTDFGVAKAIAVSRHGRLPQERPDLVKSAGNATALTGVGMTLGTPAYMAPEQVAADPNVDHRADLYALGILAYEMLVGTPPFYGASPHQLLAAQLSQPAPPIRARRSDVPPPLAVIIMRCLEKEPAQRPKSATELLRMFDSPDVTSGDFVVPARSTWTPRRVIGWSAAGALALAAAGATFWPARNDAGVPAPRPAEIAALGPSIEVSSFVAIGGDSAAGAAALGLTSQVTNALARLPGLRVAAVEGSTPGTDSVAGRRAAMRLDATVQRERDRMRVLTRLTSVESDSTVWVGTHEGSASSLFALQDSVAQAIVRAVSERIRR